MNLWEELGVNYIYRKIFKKITSNLKTEKRENYYLYEFNKLNDINNIIHLIITDINNREEIILKLQKIFEKDKNFEENINIFEYFKIVLINITKSLKSLKII